MQGPARGHVREDEATGRRLSRPSGLIAALTGITMALGGGGGAGYYLHASTAHAVEAPLPIERLAALETWRATKTALDERDRAEHAEWVAAIHEMNVTSSGLREAVVALTERMGSIDGRLRAIETGGVRTAGGKR